MILYQAEILSIPLFALFLPLSSNAVVAFFGRLMGVKIVIQIKKEKDGKKRDICGSRRHVLG